MAAQARQYESKSIYSSSRQVDDKIIPKNHRTSFPKQSSRESSPFRCKNNSHLSPVGRKRSHDSPVMKHGSPYSSSRKRERLNSDSYKTPEDHIDFEWSQHLSSSGKIYYYNKRTEGSQWEMPKDWIERDRKHNDKDRYQKDGKNKRDENSKDYSRDSRDGNRYNKEKREYRDNRPCKDLNSSGSSSKDRSYRERDSKESLNGKYRSSNSGFARSANMKSIGQSTPSSFTSSNNRSYHLTPESMNGTVQDISPPGTPTNDDTNVMNLSNISNISGVSPAPFMFTPHPCSPLLNPTSLHPALVSTQIGVSTTPHNPHLSPNIILNTTNHPVTAGLLHPLQQALLIHQQQQQQQLLLPSKHPKKELYGSPKLPTVKNHFTDTSNSSPTSPLTGNFHQQNSNMNNSIAHSSPSTRSQHSNSSTPPPPPPPPKDPHHLNNDNINKLDRFHRNNSSFEGRSSEHANTKEVPSRSKSYDSNNRLDESMHKHPSYRVNDTKYNVERQKKLSQTKSVNEQQDMCGFSSLPEFDKYVPFYSANVVDFTNNFYGNSLDKQAGDVWDDVMTRLYSDGHRTKLSLTLSNYSSNLQNTKFDVSNNWYNALDDVLQKVESLRDSNMSAANRDYKPSFSRKSKHEPSVSSSPTTTTNEVSNGELENDANSKNSTNIAMNEPIPQTSQQPEKIS